LRAALRPLAAPLRQSIKPRSFSVTATWRSDAPPVITGQGSASGAVPTDFDQATGLERMELLAKLNGEDPFFMEPLQLEHMGTLKNPIMVKSLDDHRILGCTGYPVDSHDALFFKVHKGDKATRCIECGCAYKIDYLGPPEGHGHH